MSLGGPVSQPLACSGDMNPGEPTTKPVWVSALDSIAREIPKSITRGPSSASSTFAGFRSRCTTPAAWIALRPSASPAARASTDSAGSGPWLLTASASDRPRTYAVASHGTGPSRSASMTGAVNKPLTFRATSTSRRKRARNSGSVASSARTTFTATGRPPAERPRNTRPIPPAPSRPRSRYGPISRGSSGCSSLIMSIHVLALLGRPGAPRTTSHGAMRRPVQSAPADPGGRVLRDELSQDPRLRARSNRTPCPATFRPGSRIRVACPRG